MNDLLIIALATWYVSYAITSTHGPGGVFEWVRDVVPHGRTDQLKVLPEFRGNLKRGDVIPKELLDKTYDEKIPGLLDCPVCLAFWVALILLLVPMGVVVQALAVAGAAMLAHSWSGWRFGGG